MDRGVARQADAYVGAPGQTSTNGGARQSIPRWRPPDEGSWKINVDATVSPDSRKWCLGAVIRDHSGNFFAVAAMGAEENISVLKAEARAICFTLSLVSELSPLSIAIKSDSQSIVKLLKALEKPLSYLGSTLGILNLFFLF